MAREENVVLALNRSRPSIDDFIAKMTKQARGPPIVGTYAVHVSTVTPTDRCNSQDIHFHILLTRNLF